MSKSDVLFVNLIAEVKREKEKELLQMQQKQEYIRQHKYDDIKYLLRGGLGILATFAIFGMTIIIVLAV